MGEYIFGLLFKSRLSLKIVFNMFSLLPERSEDMSCIDLITPFVRSTSLFCLAGVLQVYSKDASCVGDNASESGDKSRAMSWRISGVDGTCDNKTP
jgi:hypothetical protein